MNTEDIYALEVIINGVLIGDLDNDGFVGVDDLSIVLINWNNGASLSRVIISESSAATLLLDSPQLHRDWPPVRSLCTERLTHIATPHSTPPNHIEERTDMNEQAPRNLLAGRALSYRVMRLELTTFIKSPASAAGLDELLIVVCSMNYYCLRRRPITPSRPREPRAKVAGSGTILSVNESESSRAMPQVQT